MKKRRVKKIVSRKKPPKSVLEKKVEALAEILEKQKQDLSQLFSVLAARVNQVQTHVAICVESIDKLDTNVLAKTVVLKEVFGQLTHVGEQLKVLQELPELAENFGEKKLEDMVDAEKVVGEAKAWYDEMVSHAFSKVRGDKEKIEREHQEAREKAVAEAKKKDEVKVVEEELKRAESPDLSANSAGPGSDFPEGAEVFGG